MAKKETRVPSLSEQDLATIGVALGGYKSEVKKLMVKAEKLQLKEADTLKMKFLHVDVLLARVKGQDVTGAGGGIA